MRRVTSSDELFFSLFPALCSWHMRQCAGAALDGMSEIVSARGKVEQT